MAIGSENFITFYLKDQLFGLDLDRVSEITLVPEITPMGDPSPARAGVVTGVFNLRGKLVPAIDPKVQLGLPTGLYTLSQKVIVASHGHVQFGLIVDALGSTVYLAQEDLVLTPELSYGIPRRYLKGISQSPEGLIVILNVEELLGAFQETPEESRADGEEAAASEQPQSAVDAAKAASWGIDEATTRSVLRERALALGERAARSENGGGRKVITFRLNQETYAADLAAVKEVHRIEGYMPVPCTPEHVVGLASLRGAFLTLLDIRSFLGLPRNPFAPDACFIVTSDSLGEPAGIVVDAVETILEIDEAAVTTRISTLSGPVADYAETAATMGDLQVAVLNLERLMASERLIVGQELREAETTI